MTLSGIKIFEYLPASKNKQYANCGECGCSTCMAFAVKLADGKVSYDRCKHMSKELKNRYLKELKHSQKTMRIDSLKIGGENVLYRHENKFVNKTVFAVVVDCAKPDFMQKLKQIQDFQIIRENKKYKVDLVILKNSENSVIKNLCDETVYISENDFEKLSLIKILDNNFTKTVKKLINYRKKAILDKDEKALNPVCVFIKPGLSSYEVCARASYYVCKYANLIVFEEFEEELFSTLITLRQSIYTDPQRPLQVRSGMYEFNNPDENSIVFMTTNFSLTFYAVASELENLKVPSYLIVLPSAGMSVLTAWSAEKFTAKIIAKTLKKINFTQKVKTRKIIIPGLLEHLKEELEEVLPEFEFIVGTVEAYEISDFVDYLISNPSINNT